MSWKGIVAAHHTAVEI